MLLACSIAPARSQDVDAGRSKIEGIVERHYPWHPDKARLVARYLGHWMRVPDERKQQALINIDVNSGGLQAPLHGIDLYRSRVGRHPAYEKVVLPPSFYVKLYEVAERMITRELRTAAEFKGHSREDVEAMHRQLDRICDFAQQALESRIGGPGGQAIVRAAVDQQRADNKIIATNPWAPWRAMSDAEIAAVCSSLKAAADKCPVMTLEDGEVPRPNVVEMMRLSRSDDPALAEIGRAQSAVREAMGRFSILTEILLPELAAELAEQQRVVVAARAYMSQVTEREKAALDAAQMEEARNRVLPELEKRRAEFEAKRAAAPPDGGSSACLPPADGSAESGGGKSGGTARWPYVALGVLAIVGSAYCLHRLTARF